MLNKTFEVYGDLMKTTKNHTEFLWKIAVAENDFEVFVI